MYFLLIYIFYLYINLVNEQKILKYAVDYLSKYDSSKKNLSNVLKRKIFKLNITGIEKKRLIDILDNIIFKLEKNNLIDDERFAKLKISSLSRAGKSKNFIINYLKMKGINKLEIQEIIGDFEKKNNDWELRSAEIFARKKKLLDKNENYEKRLAKLARAGFSYDICKKILG